METSQVTEEEVSPPEAPVCDQAIAEMQAKLLALVTEVLSADSKKAEGRSEGVVVKAIEAAMNKGNVAEVLPVGCGQEAIELATKNADAYQALAAQEHAQELAYQALAEKKLN